MAERPLRKLQLDFQDHLSESLAVQLIDRSPGGHSAMAAGTQHDQAPRLVGWNEPRKVLATMD